MIMTVSLCCYGSARLPWRVTPVLRFPRLPVRSWKRTGWCRPDLRYMRLAAGTTKVTPAEDAVGACDGVIDGKWGFHTDMETIRGGKSTWVRRSRSADCRSTTVAMAMRTGLHISRCCYRATDRNSRTSILTTEPPFAAIRTRNRWSSPLQGQTARFIRLQLPGQVYFHLDEVEVFADGGETNLALQKPATQSSVSQWSVRHTLLATRSTGRRSSACRWPEDLQLAAALQELGVDVQDQVTRLETIAGQSAELDRSADEAAWQCRVLRGPRNRAGIGARQSAARLRQHPVCQASALDVSAHLGPVLRMVGSAGRRRLRAREFQDG